MLTKIKRQKALEQYQTFPLRDYNHAIDEEIFFYPKVFKSYVLTLSSKSFKGHITTLGKQLTKLAMALHTDSWVFLGDSKTPWLYQSSDYKPVKEAQDYLAFNNVGKRFEGALMMDTVELPIFLKHLAWLTRCNAALPYFHFIDQRQQIIGSICKYGNLHLDTLNKQTDKIINALVNESKFSFGDKNSCYNWFNHTSAMYGRQTVVRPKAGNIRL